MDDADDTSDADADTAQFLVGFESIPVEDFWDPAEISDFSDEVFFGYYQTRGFPHGFGAATPQSTTDNAADIGADPINHTDATHNRAADLVLDIESLTVTDPVPTNVSSNEPVPTNGSADAPDSADVLDSKDASSVSSILEKQLKAEREKNKALEKELSSTQEALKKEKLYRQCALAPRQFGVEPVAAKARRSYGEVQLAVSLLDGDTRKPVIIADGDVPSQWGSNGFLSFRATTTVPM